MIAADERLIVLHHDLVPSAPLVIDGTEVLAAGYGATWFLYKDAPWDIARVYRPDGIWTGYYIDVLEPVTWQGEDPSTLRPLVDLFLDVWISPDGPATVLDEDELHEAARRGQVTPEQESEAEAVLRDILQGVRNGTFPPPEAREFKGDEGPKIRVT